MHEQQDIYDISQLVLKMRDILDLLVAPLADDYNIAEKQAVSPVIFKQWVESSEHRASILSFSRRFKRLFTEPELFVQYRNAIMGEVNEELARTVRKISHAEREAVLKPLRERNCSTTDAEYVPHGIKYATLARDAGNTIFADKKNLALGPFKNGLIHGRYALLNHFLDTNPEICRFLQENIQQLTEVNLAWKEKLEQILNTETEFKSLTRKIPIILNNDYLPDRLRKLCQIANLLSIKGYRKDGAKLRFHVENDLMKSIRRRAIELRKEATKADLAGNRELAKQLYRQTVEHYYLSKNENNCKRALGGYLFSVKHVMDLIKVNDRNFKQLKLSNLNLNLIDFAKIAAVLKTNQYIESINLANNKFGVDAEGNNSTEILDVLASIIEFNPNIKSINLDGIKLFPESFANEDDAILYRTRIKKSIARFASALDNSSVVSFSCLESDIEEFLSQIFEIMSNKKYGENATCQR